MRPTLSNVITWSFVNQVFVFSRTTEIILTEINQQLFISTVLLVSESQRSVKCQPVLTTIFLKFAIKGTT